MFKRFVKYNLKYMLGIGLVWFVISFLNEFKMGIEYFCGVIFM